MAAVNRERVLATTPAIDTGEPRRRTTSRRWLRYEGLLYITPVIGGIIVFQLVPIIVSMYLSLADWNALQPPRFVGLQNFREMFTDDPLYLQTLRNTILFTFGAIPATTVLAFALAFLCNRKAPGMPVFRAAYFAPFITNVVAIGYIWYWIYKPDGGALNSLLSVFGINGPAWLSDSRLALFSVIIVAVWQGTGYPMVIFLAGLQGIPIDLYESASIDGASKRQQLFKITIPLMTPSTFFVLITQFISSFQVFGVIYIMTSGGPGHSTSVYIYYLYQVAFSFGRFGYAAAMAWVLFAILGIITFVQWKLQKRWVFYG